jgi:quinol monooxygenase YgiN
LPTPTTLGFLCASYGDRCFAAEERDVDKFAIWAQLEAKPGKEAEVEAFLKSAQPLAEQETGTTTWYALKIGPGKYGIFDTFTDENARTAHLNGEIAKALFAKAEELFAKAPEIDKPEILAAKAPGA